MEDSNTRPLIMNPTIYQDVARTILLRCNVVNMNPLSLAQGLWIGLICGLSAQTIGLSLLSKFTNWKRIEMAQDPSAKNDEAHVWALSSCCIFYSRRICVILTRPFCSDRCIMFCLFFLMFSHMYDCSFTDQTRSCFMCMKLEDFFFFEKRDTSKLTA